MRTAIAVLVSLFLVAACNGDDGRKAARKKKIQDYKTQLKVLNGQLAEMMPQHTDVKVTSFKAQGALKRAKKGDDENALAEAEAAYEEAKAAADEALAQEKVLEDQIRAMRDKIYDLGGEP